MNDEAIAFNILQTAIDHKANCPGESCNVSLYLLGKAYEHFAHRPLTDNESLTIFI